MNEILQAIVRAGGEPYKVGGCVRDKQLGLPSKDVDVEVFGLSAGSLCDLLHIFGKVNMVGESFGVIKLTTETDEFDFSLPRRENKTGRGYKGFQVEVDHTMTPKEAANRRDFTINAMSEKMDGQLVDPFGGEQDLKNRVLRATSEHFSEDPLRVLRGFQFVSRFEMAAESRTIQMCRDLVNEADTLAAERVWVEWEKWATKGAVPSLGLKFLRDTNWLELYPELLHLVDVPQDPIWHPEGCAWTHTLHVCDEAARICDRENLEGEPRVTIILAALCHDLGKAMPEHGGTTNCEKGRWVSPAHAEVGVPLARKFLERIGCLERIIEQVLPLVAEHMICSGGGEITDRVVRRLAMRLGKANVRQLMLVIEADHGGRPPLAKGLPAAAKDIAFIADRLVLEDGKPKPIVGGKHLLHRGFQPGPYFGQVIKQCFEAQLDGAFDDEVGAMNHLDELLKGGK